METTCCIVGGGPAGVMLGYLLARRGVELIVLEKHKDFFRDFRGDTIHPSTFNVLDELGLLNDLLKVPHQKVEEAGAWFGDYRFRGADFRHSPTKCKFVGLMPQWDFLDFLAEKARAFAGFRLEMEHKAVALVREGGAVRGVKVETPDGEREVRADLVVACDGRHSTMRGSTGLKLE